MTSTYVPSASSRTRAAGDCFGVAGGVRVGTVRRRFGGVGGHGPTRLGRDDTEGRTPRVWASRVLSMSVFVTK
jgi:hypothetical protein